MAFNIADLFERAVDTFPDRLAMAVGDEHLTFSELDAAANRFANHLRSVRSGTVTATATPIFQGRTTEVWSIEIRDEAGKLVCVSRCTLAVIAPPSGLPTA